MTRIRITLALMEIIIKTIISLIMITFTNPFIITTIITCLSIEMYRLFDFKFLDFSLTFY